MQDSLFPEDGLPVPEPTPAVARRAKKQNGSAHAQPASRVLPQPANPDNIELAAALPRLVHLGTSSWTFPGWKGLVWDGDYSDAQLSKHGLAAYAQHPLFRAVSLDRAFYRPLSAQQYASYAAQVNDGFRFSVEAPALVTDATVRGESGRATEPNPAFLDPELALQEFVQPALAGLGPPERRP